MWDRNRAFTLTKERNKNERLFNDTFNVASPTWLNACTGENGFQDIETYAEAYRLAPRILLDKVISQGSVNNLTDTLVFPIVFCMRHAVELQIKDSIIKLSKIRPNLAIESYNVSSSHDIGDIWHFFKEQSQNTDSRYSDLTRKIDPYINNIAEIDPTGQVFRYPNDNKRRKHLVQTPIVNLLLLKNRFGELEGYLEELNRLNNDLIEEYSVGTVTVKLSRNDIYKIATRLPDREEWEDNAEFGKSREGIKKDFRLTSNQFSKVVNIIQGHYEFSQEINLEIHLRYSNSDDYLIYFDCLNNIHPDRKVTASPSDIGLKSGKEFIGLVEEIQKQDLIISDCVERCLENISYEALADIEALYELGRYPSQYWSENYARLLDIQLKDYKRVAERGHVDLKRKVGHRLEKTNAKKSIILSLNKLGQITILNSLHNKFGFDV